MFITFYSSSTVNIYTVSSVLELNVKFEKILIVIKYGALHFMLILPKFVIAIAIIMVVKQHSFLVFIGIYSTFYPPIINNAKAGY